VAALPSSRSLPRSKNALDATVLICTYNRAAFLRETLASLARIDASGLAWDIVVVDNNSTDDTRAVVAEIAAIFPVPLRYLFEPRQGKSYALNTGLQQTSATVIAFTDDDVRVSEKWLTAACAPLLETSEFDYTGGPVHPIWEVERPRWIHETRSDLWGPLAILDYGDRPFCFEDARRVPLGVNMAVRRTLCDRIGGFDPALGRRGASLLGQEQAEFFCRSRAAGARGLYVPSMAVEHHVPKARLTRQYFRRWWFWKGVSKRRLEAHHTTTELGLDLATVARFAGVPRFMFGSALRDSLTWFYALATRDTHQRAVSEMMLCYFVGYVTSTPSRGRLGHLHPLSNSSAISNKQ
jgi:glycosyltransferase involved in cell wall biosynthesis